MPCPTMSAPCPLGGKSPASLQHQLPTLPTPWEQTHKGPILRKLALGWSEERWQDGALVQG